MDSFIELWNVAVAPVNLVFTVLLAIILLYWGLVGLGCFDLHLFDAQADVDTDDGGIFDFINIGEVPTMLVVSALVFSMWLTVITTSFYFNPHGSWGFAFLLWIPCFIGSVFLTKVLTAPLRKFFKRLEEQVEAASVKMIGMVCEVTSLTVDEAFGTARIETGAAPLLLNIRAAGAEELKKGDRALVIAEDTEKRIFKVIRHTQPELN